MSGETLKIFLAMAAYMLVVIGIGLYFAKRAQENSENFFLGGRSLGPWVAAMSAEASDMSGFPDYSSYIELFRKYYGCTPLKYKKLFYPK